VFVSLANSSNRKHRVRQEMQLERKLNVESRCLDVNYILIAENQVVGRNKDRKKLAFCT
jgi:hypothetical protein